MSPLAERLSYTHISLVEGCEELGIDPESVDLNTLEVFQCDNCSLWDKHSTMKTAYDGSLLCKFCSAEYL
jgi:hypothetical protein